MNFVRTGLRVCFLDQSGELGGAELCLADLAEAVRDRCTVILFQDGPFVRLLGERGVKVHVVTLPSSIAMVRKAAGILSYGRAMFGLGPFLWRVARCAADSDVLYANTMKALLTAALVSLLLRKPFCFHLHDLLSTAHFSVLNRRLVVFLADRAALVVANSEASARAYREAGGRNPRLHVLYNGFCVERFSAVPSEVATSSLPEEIRSEAAVVGIFGRVTPWKGQHVLLEALPLLPEVHALIVGDALFTPEDRRYRMQLEWLAERLGVRHRVHFLGFRAHVQTLFCAVDVVAHCSVAPEPFGRVVVEAMLLGRPVVATRAGGVLELVEDGRTGILTEPGSPSDLARAVQSLLADPVRARNMGEAGRLEATVRFGLPQILAGWEQLMAEAAGIGQRG
jgi:glycosyltransferase involved in cell wall biosynthesis